MVQTLTELEMGQKQLAAAEAALAAMQTSLAKAGRRWERRLLEAAHAKAKTWQSRLAGYWHAYLPRETVVSGRLTQHTQHSNGAEKKESHRAFEPADRGVEVDGRNGHH